MLSLRGIFLIMMVILFIVFTAISVHFMNYVASGGPRGSGEKEKSRDSKAKRVIHNLGCITTGSTGESKKKEKSRDSKAKRIIHNLDKLTLDGAIQLIDYYSNNFSFKFNGIPKYLSFEFECNFKASIEDFSDTFKELQRLIKSYELDSYNDVALEVYEKYMANLRVFFGELDNLPRCDRSSAYTHVDITSDFLEANKKILEKTRTLTSELRRLHYNRQSTVGVVPAELSSLDDLINGLKDLNSTTEPEHKIVDSTGEQQSSSTGNPLDAELGRLMQRYS